MRSTRWLVVALLSVFGVLAVVGATPERAEAQSYEAAEIETVELINAYRQENGLGTLSLSSPLSVASERHSEDMGTYGFFAHDTVQSSYYAPGSSHSERIAQEGYDYNTFTAENLAYGQATPQEVFEAWRNSPGHNAAMLGDYAVIGIGLVNVGGVPYWTTVFGAEVDPSAAPVGSAPSSGGAAPAEAPQEEPTTSEPTAQAVQYDNAASEQYEEAEIEPVASGEQYDEAEEPAATSAADQYLENADRLRAAAAQYGEEAQQAEAEIAALQAAQQQPATPQATPEAPIETVGAVSPEPQVSAPTSAAQEIPVPEIEDPAAVETSSGQPDGDTDEGAGGGAGEGSESPSEAMASVGMTVLPDTGGPPLGALLGTALVVCVLVTARGLRG